MTTRPTKHRLRRGLLPHLTLLAGLFTAGLVGSIMLVGSPPSQAAATATTLQLTTTSRDACTPTSLSAPAGSITIRFTNPTDDQQNFGIVGVGTGSPDDVRRGESATLTADLAAGTYTFWCGDDADDGMRGTLTVTASSGGGSTPTTGTTSTTAPAPPAAVTLTANDDYFTPSTLSAAAGEVTVTVRNAGSDDHTFTIGGLANVILRPGETKTVTFNAAAGTYRFFCAYHGSMTGTLNVTGGSAPPPGGTTPTPTPTTTTPTTPAPAPPASSSWDVQLSDFAFAPSTLSAPAGTVSLTLRNTGQLPHTFTVDGLVNAQLSPGETRTVSFQATDGTYRIYCAAPGHADIGMVGSLVVGSGGGGAGAGGGGAGSGAPGTTTPGGGGGAPASGDVTLNDFSFAPATLTVPAGAVSLTIANAGRLPHTFTIDGLVNVSVPPGRTATVSFQASPGTYRVYCAEGGHVGLGMVGSLVVLEPGAAPPPPSSGPPAGSPHAGHDPSQAADPTRQPASLPPRCRPKAAFVLRGSLLTAAAGQLTFRATWASKKGRRLLRKKVRVLVYPKTKFTLPQSMLTSGLEAGSRLRVQVGKCRTRRTPLIALRVAVSPPPATLPPGTLQLKADATGMPKFDKQTLEAPAGKVTLRLVNPAPLPHNIGIEGVAVGKTVGKGGVSTVTAELEPGRYTFYCAVPGHAAAGMKGTLVVK